MSSNVKEKLKPFIHFVSPNSIVITPSFWKWVTIWKASNWSLFPAKYILNQNMLSLSGDVVCRRDTYSLFSNKWKNMKWVVPKLELLYTLLLRWFLKKKDLENKSIYGLLVFMLINFSIIDHLSAIDIMNPTKFKKLVKKSEEQRVWKNPNPSDRLKDLIDSLLKLKPT